MSYRDPSSRTLGLCPLPTDGTMLCHFGLMSMTLLSCIVFDTIGTHGSYCIGAFTNVSLSVHRHGHQQRDGTSPSVLYSARAFVPGESRLRTFF
jgi:hypothetical protein